MVGSVPAMMFQLRWVRPSYFIPTCELVWSVLVMAMAAAKNVQTVRVTLGPLPSLFSFQADSTSP